MDRKNNRRTCQGNFIRAKNQINKGFRPYIRREKAAAHKRPKQKKNNFQKGRKMQASYNRSRHYREKFIRMHPPDRHGKYRCVYCGRKIKAEEMQVDHIVPVGAVRRRPLLRAHMKGRVNDMSNLVPSCRRCNLKKASKTGLRYRIRAWLGSHEGYWKFRKAARAILILLLVSAVCYWVRHPSQVLHFWDACKGQASSRATDLWQKIGSLPKVSFLPR